MKKYFLALLTATALSAQSPTTSMNVVGSNTGVGLTFNLLSKDGFEEHPKGERDANNT